MILDLTTALILIATLGVGVFLGYRWATESRRLDDFIEGVEAENPPDLPPWSRYPD